MKRSWLNFVAAFVSVAFGAVCGTAVAGHGGGGGGFHGGAAPQISRPASFVGVRPASFNGPVAGNMAGAKVAKPLGSTRPPLVPSAGSPGKGTAGGGSGLGKLDPTVPPITGGTKLPGGGKIPFPPEKLPPITGGGTKVPGGGKIPFPPGKLPPITGGGTKQPGGGGGTQPPGGGTQPPSGGGTGGNHGNCKPCWPPIVLGCLPCVGYGGCYGGYYPPVYSPTVVVPAAAPVVIADATPTAPAATTAATSTAVATGDKLPQVPVGAKLTLQAKDLGLAKGQVLLVMDKVTLGVQIDEWNNDYATATLPLVGISGLTESEIVLVRADGHPASSVKVELVPQQQAGG